MAVVFVSTVTASTAVAGTTLTITGVNASVGDFLSVNTGCDNTGIAAPTATIADSGSNTWSTAAHTTGAIVTAGSGVILENWVCLVTTALSAGTITITFSASITNKAAQCHRWTGISSATPSAARVSAGSGTATANSTVTSNSVPIGDLCIGTTVIENGTAGAITAFDSDTTNGSWSTGVATNIGASSTGLTIAMQYKITSGAAGTQTWDLTYAAARKAYSVVGFPASAGGGGSTPPIPYRTVGNSAAIQRAANW
jgi:hypothetical protein